MRVALVPAIVVCGAVSLARADPPQVQAVEALAYGFPSIDEHDLGVMFSADLTRIDGSPRFYDRAEPKRTARGELDKHLYRASSSETIEAGVEFSFIGLGVHQTDTSETVVVHAHEIKTIASIDETTHKTDTPVPDGAMFYLAEVHLGTSIDVMMEGDYTDTGEKLSVAVFDADASLEKIERIGSYKIDIKGLGVTDVTGAGVFSTGLDKLAKNYRAEAAPIELVFRVLPGKTYQPRFTERPTLVASEHHLRMGERKAKQWTLEPGRYHLAGSSAPNGFGIKWSSMVDCDNPEASEYRNARMLCTVVVPTTLTIWNPPVSHDLGDSLTGGPDETMDLEVQKLAGQANQLEPDVQRILALFDQMAELVIADRNDCAAIARDAERVTGDLVDATRSPKSTEQVPAWATTHVNHAVNAMKPALSHCAGNERLRNVFQQLQNLKK